MTHETNNGKIHLYSPMKAIRRKCLDCCCGSSQEVRSCHIEDCALHPYRLGKRPGAVKREVTPAQIERLKKAREALLNARISSSPLIENRENLVGIQNEG